MRMFEKNIIVYKCYC